jgi:hypothetical protein
MLTVDSILLLRLFPTHLITEGVAFVVILAKTYGLTAQYTVPKEANLVETPTFC